MILQVVTPPATFPVTLAEAKAQCRIDIDDEDDLIYGFIGAATERVQLAARRTLMTTVYDLFFDAWPSFPIRLELPPVVSVTGIYNTPEDASEIEWAAANNYAVNTNSEPARIVYRRNATTPSPTLEPVNAVRIRYTAGYGSTASAVPDRYRQAIRMLIGHYYENREALLVAQGLSMSELPLAVADLINIDRGSWF
jgi:uncharacterized phiE125 gp8 family phage protein